MFGCLPLFGITLNYLVFFFMHIPSSLPPTTILMHTHISPYLFIYYLQISRIIYAVEFC